MKKTFNPTEGMREAAKEVFTAMAYTKTIRGIVEPYRNRILVEIKAVNVETGEPVTKDFDAYLMSDEQFNLYVKRCNEERIKAGLKVECEGYCPLLVAEELERKAKRALIKALNPITGVDVDGLLCLGMDNYHKYVDLSLRLMASFV